jgi:D-amino peptidase
MRVYIMTDLEGCSGITLFDQTRNSLGPRYPESRRLLMGDINAAVQGALDGGASYVVVVDGHGNPLNLLPELMHPGAEFLCGRGFPEDWGAGDSFDCGFLVGYHAMARTPDGVLCHTQNSRSDARYWYHGREYGEIGQEALILGHFGVPITLVTGDTATCREAREFLGDEVVTVAVKHGYGRECCRMLAPERAHELIRAGAAEALTRVGRVAPYKVELPIPGRFSCLAEPWDEGAYPADIDERERIVRETTFTDQLNIYRFTG